MGADQYGVQTRDRADLVQVLDGWNAFNVGDQDFVTVAFFQILLELRFQGLGIGQSFLKSPTDGYCSSAPITATGTIGALVSSARRMKPGLKGASL